MSYPKLVFIDDEVSGGEQCHSRKLFGTDCTSAFTDIPHLCVSVLAIQSPDRFLEQLTKGDLRPNGVLLDLNFEKLTDVDSLDLVDPWDSEIGECPKQEWGQAVLRTIKRIDPDLPVVILTSLTASNPAFKAGRFGADEYCGKYILTEALLKANDSKNPEADDFKARVARAITVCQERAVYDHEHLRLIDAFADNYDEAERRKCATMAYYRFEDDFIDKTIRDLVLTSPGDRRVNVLDLGCGTARIEEYLCLNKDRGYDIGKIQIAAVDFSGKVLEKAKSKLDAIPQCLLGFGKNLPTDKDGKLHVSLFRAPAENIEFLRERYPDGFDLAIMGFGLLSYVRYGSVLPAKVGSAPNSGLVPLLRPGAKIVFSVYNEQSAIYDRIRMLGTCAEEDDLPMAALMNLATGRLRVGSGMEIACEAFRCERIVRFMRQAGLSVDPDDVTTFPTAHLALSNKRVMHVPDSAQVAENSESGDQKDSGMPGFQNDPILAPGRFSPSLIELDSQLSRTLRDRGHYVMGLATKPENSKPAGGSNE